MYSIKYARKDCRSNSKDIGTNKDTFWDRKNEYVPFKELKRIGIFRFEFLSVHLPMCYFGIPRWQSRNVSLKCLVVLQDKNLNDDEVENWSLSSFLLAVPSCLEQTICIKIVYLFENTHSRFGHYFYSNHYGRAPRGPRSVKKSHFFWQINMFSSCAKIEPKLKKLWKTIQTEKKSSKMPVVWWFFKFSSILAQS